MEQHKKHLIEAALFMTHKPISTQDLARIAECSEKQVEEEIEELKLDHKDKGVDIAQTPQGWIMQVKTHLIEKVAHLAPYADLSDGMLKSLAIIVYKQPVSQSFLVKVQGNKVYNYIKLLETRGLIKAEKSGRTKNITTTSDFESYFGMTIDEVKKIVERDLQDKEIKQAPKKKKEVKSTDVTL
jgi:segregation and condensation protein B